MKSWLFLNRKSAPQNTSHLPRICDVIDATRNLPSCKTLNDHNSRTHRSWRRIWRGLEEKLQCGSGRVLWGQESRESTRGVVRSREQGKYSGCCEVKRAGKVLGLGHEVALGAERFSSGGCLPRIKKGWTETTKHDAYHSKVYFLVRMQNIISFIF